MKLFKKVIAIAVGLLLYTQSAFANVPHVMPPYKPEIIDSIATLLPNSKLIFYEPEAGIGYNEPGDVNLSYIMRQNKIARSLALSSMPPRGFNILALCLQFPDKLPQTGPEFFDSLLFYPPESIFGPYARPPVSVNAFYQEMTGGNLQLVTLDSCVTVGWLMMPQSYSYYTNNNYGLGAYPNNTQKLFEDAISVANPFVDFSKYDNDINGYVDGVVLIHPGRGAEFSGSTADIWSHKWGVAGKRYDNVWLSSYSVQPEYWNSPGDMTIGVYGHEIGHLFGLPDLYDTDNSSRGLGKWDMMAGGSWNGNLGNNPAVFGAECSIRLQTKSVVDITADSRIELSPEYKSQFIHRIPVRGSTTSYYLITNRYERTTTSWVRKGVVIQRVDRTKGNNTKEWYPGKETTGNYVVAMMQAGNGWGLEKNTTGGLPTDPYRKTEGTFFGPYTKPSNNWYDGSNSFFKLYNLTEDTATGNATFSFEECSDCPYQLDFNADGIIGYDDIIMVDSIAFKGGEGIKDATCPYSRSDLNCDGITNALDVRLSVNYWNAIKSGRTPKPICKSCR